MASGSANAALSLFQAFAIKDLTSILVNLFNVNYSITVCESLDSTKIETGTGPNKKERKIVSQPVYYRHTTRFQDVSVRTGRPTISLGLTDVFNRSADDRKNWDKELYTE